MGESSQQEVAEKEAAAQLKQDIEKSLEALRPFTPVPPTQELPTGVTAGQWQDMKNLTDLLNTLRPKTPEPAPQTGATQNSTPLPAQPAPQSK